MKLRVSDRRAVAQYADVDPEAAEPFVEWGKEADRVAGELVAACRALLDEDKEDGITAAGIARVESAVQELREFEDRP